MINYIIDEGALNIFVNLFWYRFAEAGKVIPVPSKVVSLEGLIIKMASLGSEHSIAVTGLKCARGRIFLSRNLSIHISFFFFSYSIMIMSSTLRLYSFPYMMVREG